MFIILNLDWSTKDGQNDELVSQNDEYISQND
jgi:hypothetical protein